MRKCYWAIRPIGNDYKNTIRIEQAETPNGAARLAFGRGDSRGHYECKNMGTRLAVIQSDKKRVALLKDPNDWHVIK